MAGAAGTIRRVVVGVAPDEAGGAALHWALTEAVSRAVPLTAVRTWSPSVYAMGYTGVYASGEADLLGSSDAQQIADEQLKLARERVAGADSVVCTAVAAIGAPAPTLLEAAADGALLVVGTRGHGALSRVVLGSVSSAVLHHATGPVVIVPEPTEDDRSAGRVLVGVDHSAPSLAALAAGLEQARRRSAVLMPIYIHQPVLADAAGLGVCAPEPADLVETEEAMLRSATTAAGAHGMQVKAEVVIGHPGETLTRLARPQDLLVLGSRGRGGFRGLLLGSTSTQTVQHATCPVMVVRA